ncbi:hypothetical protein [Fructilactobacillus fructivorans]|uniref:Uncharacterized protein n=1 Tax=Fructilactobacillus fructivorans TaxID=1614 RepID=A0A0C1PQY8_9LACO|nr:hypothetical protein [Fructilactobacillus fructivorans]KID42291.1 hypothetical protein LfDm3_0220 [Fructilactobacillus fructivorans]MCT0151089.1 hypothetical protein [Fructilactobacillus fructivorans]MCT2867353.1 hypothetical protein [Fructilactobacillus fructivorans]MCT2869128.1 hypothetical protein [Fructilactobacillus fructivorans]MCT2873152.1 hypothetical protein [Fructilactobacillus fructivorans]
MSKINNQQWFKIVNYVFIFFLVLSCKSVFWVSTFPAFKIVKVGAFFLPLLIVLGYAFYYRDTVVEQFKKIMMPLIIFIVFISVFLIFNFLIYHYSLPRIGFFCLYLPIILYLYSCIVIHKKQDVIVYFINIVSFLSVISLFFWLLSEFDIPTNTEFVAQWGHDIKVPGYLIFQFIPQGAVPFLGINIVRNTGLFIEAPMFSFVLSSAIIFSLFLCPDLKQRKSKLLILYVTIITTTSTTGIIISLLSLVIYIFAVEWKKIVKNVSRIDRYAIGLVLIAFAGCFAGFAISSKMQSMKGSTTVRSNDIMAGFHAFMLHPIIGNGIGNFDILKKFMLASRLKQGGNDGFSAGLMQVLAYGGIALLLVYLVPLIFSIIKRDLNTTIVSSLLLVLLFFTIVNEVELYFFLSIYLVSYLYLTGGKQNNLSGARPNKLLHFGG